METCTTRCRPITLFVLATILLTGASIIARSEDALPVPPLETRQRFIDAHLDGQDGFDPGEWLDIDRTVHDEYDVDHYDVSLDLDIPSHVITGRVEVEATAQVANLTEIVLDLSTVLTVDAVTAGGSPAAYTHLSSLLTITLDATYQPGESFTVACDYHGTPSASGTPFRWNWHSGVPVVLSYSEPLGAPAWWVCKDDPKDKATFDIHVTAPDSLDTVSNGYLESVVDNGNGTTTFNWITDYLMSTYLFSIVTTNFASWSEVYTGLDSVTTMPVDYFAYPEDLADAQIDWSNNVQMMEYFARLFGEYPFMEEKYAIAEFQHPGAMEHQTATSMGWTWITGNHANEFVVVHELAHMWVGDMITMRDWTHAWCKEGFATYCEALYFEDLYGEAYYHNYMSSFNIFAYANRQLYAISPPLHAAIYYKGAWVLHMLRHVLGEEDFFAGIYAYTNDANLRYGVANTEELRDSFEAASGVDLDWFFDQWIFNPGYPIFTQYVHSQPAGGGGHDVFLDLVQVQNTGPIFKMPIDVVIETTLGEERFVVWDSLYAQQFAFHVEGEPLSLTLDPDDWVIMTATTADLAESTPRLEGALTQNWPNPFNPSTTISFTLPTRGRARLRIYDIGGRLVLKLFDRVAGPGRHEVIWDGRGVDGAAMPSGVYFHRLELEDGSRGGRMVLAR